jgi:hypothetical protein
MEAVVAFLCYTPVRKEETCAINRFGLQLMLLHYIEQARLVLLTELEDQA